MKTKTVDSYVNTVTAINAMAAGSGSPFVGHPLAATPAEISGVVAQKLNWMQQVLAEPTVVIPAQYRREFDHELAAFEAARGRVFARRRAIRDRLGESPEDADLLAAEAAYSLLEVVIGDALTAVEVKTQTCPMVPLTLAQGLQIGLR